MNAFTTTCVFAVLVCGMLWTTGCSPLSPVIPQDKPPAVPSEERYFIHKVAGQGENFISIATWYTGSGENWLSLVKANPLIDPRRIKIGDSIRIPENLLTRREPMPSNPPPVAKKKEKVAQPSAPALSPIGESELFGPIDIEGHNSHLEENNASLPLETLE